ncbi:ornithine decarboxylase-like [Sabethes cyaneus]|uniref:ornithine decarboxylase-like n=1 Tax=Sabethes cyaneus TaxID=53552 RepID=UPI00237E8D8C|nr:ornithine decarboxylase-like [Sabethes cyaneus]
MCSNGVSESEVRTRTFTLLEETSSIEEVIEGILATPAAENPFHVLFLDDIVRKHLNWLRQLPRVRPFYAVKCNDDRAILETLAALGTGFDCASKGEIDRVMEMGVNPRSRIIYAHPIKSKESLRYAKAKAVSMMTFDNELELVKIAEVYPDARLVLRIRHDSDKALVPLGKKFGCDAHLDGPKLLRKAKALNLTVVGISFHVGCGSLDADSFFRAISAAKVLFDYAKTIGFEFTLLDLGGGFPGDAEKPIDEFALAVNNALDEFFPNLDEIQVIAEPGRYYVASAVRLLTVIQGMKIIRDPTDDDRICHVMYYLNDGVYGTLFDWVSLRAINDLQRVMPVITKQKRDKQCLKSTVWGPTCDATDIICENVDFPEHSIGEYVLFENIGAYGMTFATNFNGFPTPVMRVYAGRNIWNSLETIKSIDWKQKNLDFLQKYLRLIK